MRRHTEARQLALYAAITDAMVELLVETVHKIGTRSKRKVVGDIAKDVERVYGKERVLVDIATALSRERSLHQRKLDALISR